MLLHYNNLNMVKKEEVRNLLAVLKTLENRFLNPFLCDLLTILNSKDVQIYNINYNVMKAVP